MSSVHGDTNFQFLGQDGALGITVAKSSELAAVNAEVELRIRLLSFNQLPPRLCSVYHIRDASWFLVHSTAYIACACNTMSSQPVQRSYCT